MKPPSHVDPPVGSEIKAHTSYDNVAFRRPCANVLKETFIKSRYPWQIFRSHFCPSLVVFLAFALVMKLLLLSLVASGSKKKQKLAALSGIGGVSDASLSSILAALKEDPTVLDDGISARSVGRQAMDAFDTVSTTLALPLENGSVFDWSVAEPRLLLPYLCEASEAFRRIMASVEQRYSLILYVDEFTPGDPLHPETCRKTAGF